MIRTPFTDMMKLQYPIIAAPMFLVSNEKIVVAASEAGGIGTFPALNYRPISGYRDALQNMRAKTKKPIGVNIIVHNSNSRQSEDLKVALDNGVELFITSLGNPKEVIKAAQANGAKVICDVTNLTHALKVQDLGADGVIAVSQGAGGHAGPTSPLVLLPWLKSELEIPVVAAGGISHGAAIAACLALGADAVSVGTRFIASHEADVPAAYKEAIVKSTAEDIVMTDRISGTPAAVIRTPYIERVGTELPWLVKRLKNHPRSKKLVTAWIHAMGMRGLQTAVAGPTWKNVWSAGQSVGLIDEVLSVQEIMARLVAEYHEAVKRLSAFSPIK